MEPVCNFHPTFQTTTGQNVANVNGTSMYIQILKKGEIGLIKEEKWTEKINVNHKCWLCLYYIYNVNSVVYHGYG